MINNTIFVIVYLYFVISSLLNKYKYTTIGMNVFALNFYSIAISGLSYNIELLYTLIIVEILTFLVLVKLAKSLTTKIKYYITIMLSSVSTIIAITCSFGYYYVRNSIIDGTLIPYLNIKISIISNMINGIINGAHLFYYSLNNYFVYPDSFVQRTQFYLGICMGAIIFENIFSILRNFLNKK